MIYLYLYIVLNFFGGYLVIEDIKRAVGSVDNYIDLMVFNKPEEFSSMSHKEIKVFLYVILAVGGFFVYLCGRK